ncbi:MAG: hypothetical protein AB1791_12755 [Chloroflexota bacterium]
MTILICLNFGDKIHLVSDSMLSYRGPDGRLVPTGSFCGKLYPLGSHNALIGFAGSRSSAADAIRRIDQFARLHQSINEEQLFDEIPALLVERSRYWKVGTSLSIVYAGLIPDSQAYDREKFPGVGIPPKTACGVVSLAGREGPPRVERGRAIQVPSNPGIRFSTSDYRLLMDGFIVGSGKITLADESYLHLKYAPADTVELMLVAVFQEHFLRLPVERTGVGGAFQVALLTNSEKRVRIMDFRDRPTQPIIQQTDGAIHIIDTTTGSQEIIQDLWDDRLPFDFAADG